MENDRYENALRLRQEGYSLQQIGNMLGISKSTVYRLLEETDTEEEEDATSVWEEQIASLENQVATLKNLLREEQKKQSEESVKQSFAKEQKAQYLITTFHRITADVYDQVKLKTWQVSDYEICVKQIENLKTLLVYYAFNVLNTEHEELLVWVYLTRLQSKIVEMLSLYNREVFRFFKLELKLTKPEMEELERMKQLESVDTLVNTKPT